LRFIKRNVKTNSTNTKELAYKTYARPKVSLIEKSVTATSICLPLAMLSKIAWLNVSNCVSQLSFDLKPC
jgi:hypothetical protein